MGKSSSDDERVLRRIKSGGAVGAWDNVSVEVDVTDRREIWINLNASVSNFRKDLPVIGKLRTPNFNLNVLG